MDNLIGYPERKLKKILEEWGEKPYRAHQIFTWIYHYRNYRFAGMTNLSKVLRQKLEENFCIALPRIILRTPSRDGSVKYLFALEDGAEVEAIWMPETDRTTLCLSTQVGCRLACSFCLTASMGLKRQLTPAEIIGQYIAVNEDHSEAEQISNIVFMGMGEPLDNYDAVCEALRLMVSPEALRISTRKITLSTSGLVDRIERFKGENLHVNLAISLNATDNATRDQIMPINRKYPIEVLLECLRTYPLKPSRRLTFEYVMLKGINDTDEDARRLVKLLHGIPAKVNLIPFNAYQGAPYQPPSQERIKAFQDYLLDRHFSVFVRKNRGTDILGACGQLAVQTA
ncbi:23S rRNA (adenine(2503)-C(2))-methyltransferase RlmN [Nitrospina watsonii]|uniref:Probable dual-specificity RNA methyltransferase RlmN n=1 Tax=Nitrospina watsonii TaxID=1323948 RepID=A0ABM9HDT0_9BACT|nr:23S rRNA (adenine(2503)-C(2))-methyltransferase RlmN [Nitrospina watsonii]CAI2718238.1 Dual-specificity RNA methyltransferase RlmN [Nitrospina watsonii]